MVWGGKKKGNSRSFDPEWIFLERNNSARGQNSQSQATQMPFHFSALIGLCTFNIIYRDFVQWNIYPFLYDTVHNVVESNWQVRAFHVCLRDVAPIYQVPVLPFLGPGPIICSELEMLCQHFWARREEEVTSNCLYVERLASERYHV